MNQYLSHVISEHTPGFGGESGFEKTVRSSIDLGQSSNSFTFKMNNHLGTHLDLPRHFIRNGKCLDDYPAKFWINRRAVLIDIAAAASTLITAIEVKNKLDEIPAHRLLECNTLFIRTGFEAHRQKMMFWQSNPGFSPEVAVYLKERHPQIQMLGMDTISLTSFTHREVGRDAHRAFLGEERGAPILLLEDMHLAEMKETFFTVSVIPLRISGADGVPCTVMTGDIH